MEILQAIINFISNTLAQAPIMVGCVAALGLILQRKSVSQVLTGTFKAAMGTTIMLEATSVIMSAMTPLATMFDALFN